MQTFESGFFYLAISFWGSSLLLFVIGSSFPFCYQAVIHCVECSTICLSIHKINRYLGCFLLDTKNTANKSGIIMNTELFTRAD